MTVFRRIAPAAPAETLELEEKPVVVDGYRGMYVESGDAGAPALVLLATTLVRSKPYAPVIRRLAAGFHVYAVDMPGCGRAQRLQETWTFERYARWADGFLAHFGLDRVTLVGHSNSAGAALVAAALYPGRIAGAVLSGSVGADERPSYFRVLLGRALDAFLEPWLSLTGWHHLAYNALLHTRNFFGQVKASIKTDLRPYAPRVAAPVLLAWGRRDHTMPLRCARALQALLPRASLHVAHGGSHDWIITNPDEFAAAVERFAYETTAEGNREGGA